MPRGLPDDVAALYRGIEECLNQTDGQQRKVGNLQLPVRRYVPISGNLCHTLCDFPAGVRGLAPNSSQRTNTPRARRK